MRLNCTIPAFVNRSVGSSAGTSDELGRTTCALRSKYARNRRRISDARIRLTIYSPRDLETRTIRAEARRPEACPGLGESRTNRSRAERGRRTAVAARLLDRATAGCEASSPLPARSAH